MGLDMLQAEIDALRKERISMLEQIQVMKMEAEQSNVQIADLERTIQNLEGQIDAYRYCIVNLGVGRMA